MKKVTKKEVYELLKNSRRLVLTMHVNPDGDAFGSTLGLAHSLMAMGKEVQIVLDDKRIPPKFAFLKGYEKIRLAAEGETIDADLLVSLDASTKDRIGRLPQIVKAPVLNIDHHVSNTEYADYLYLEPNYAATGEIIAELLLDMEMLLDKDTADCLYLAMATDTGFFKFANTTEHTLTMAARMIGRGARPNFVSESFEMRSEAELNALKSVLETLDYHYDGKVCGLSVPKDVMEQEGISTDGFVDYPRSLCGVEVAYLLKYVDQEVTRVSLRSKNINVIPIAETFGGGGHMRASGCTIQAGLEEAKQKLLEAMKGKI